MHCMQPVEYPSKCQLCIWLIYSCIVDVVWSRDMALVSIVWCTVQLSVYHQYCFEYSWLYYLEYRYPYNTIISIVWSTSTSIRESSVLFVVKLSVYRDYCSSTAIRIRISLSGMYTGSYQWISAARRDFHIECFNAKLIVITRLCQCCSVNAVRRSIPARDLPQRCQANFSQIF